MQEYMNLSPTDALAKDLWDARRIYMEDGLYTYYKGVRRKMAPGVKIVVVGRK